MPEAVSPSSVAVKYLGSAAIAILMTGMFGLAGAVQAAEVRHQDDEHLKPNGRGIGDHDPSGMTAAAAAKLAPISTNGIAYHGGPVMLNTVNMYYIW
jgi:hypothetical protein